MTTINLREILTELDEIIKAKSGCTAASHTGAYESTRKICIKK